MGMRLQPRQLYAWLVVGPLLLAMVGFLIVAALAAQPDLTPVPSRYRILSVTVGGVACPHSVVAGWTRGRDPAAVTNVAPCPRGSTLAVWTTIHWQSGRRTSLCLDPGHTRC